MVKRSAKVSLRDKAKECFQKAEQWPENSPCRKFWKDEAQRHLDAAEALKKKREEEEEDILQAEIEHTQKYAEKILPAGKGDLDTDTPEHRYTLKEFEEREEAIAQLTPPAKKAKVLLP